MVFSKFGKHGDNVDVSICNGCVIMIRSDGVLFTFSLSEANNEKADNVKEWDDILPSGEYEALCSIDANGQVYLACKHYSADKTSNRTSGYIFKLGNNGSLTATGSFEINVRDIEKKIGIDKISFHPSALTQNPFTKEWYILSSVNKLLVFADKEEVNALNPSLIPQPEGIGFDKRHPLHISNERNTAAYRTVLKFVYHKN